MYGYEATFQTLRQFVRWDTIPKLEPIAECQEGDPRCWPSVHDQRAIVRSFEGRAGPRDPSLVSAIEVHQMDCELGVSALQLHAAKGDHRQALRNRVLKQAYHVVGLLDGDVIRNHYVERYTHHGGAGNSFSLGLALEGSYPGREKSRTAKHTAIERMIAVGRAALCEAEKMLREAGVTGPIRVNAHRNFSSQRAADPGEAIWREVVVWGCNALGLVPDLDIHRSTGLPVPIEWDPAAKFTWTGAPRG